MMDDVLEYAKVPVTIQSYAKDQSYAKETDAHPEPNNTRCAWRRASIRSHRTGTEEVSRLKTNDDGNFTLDGIFSPQGVRNGINLSWEAI